ncbi:MAG: FAD-binding oxidoreductase [Actinomycetota bacterium]
MATLRAPGPALRELRKGFSGNVFEAGDAGYDQARAIFNAMIDRRPAVIAQCQTIEDVSTAIRIGRESGLEISVRGGGHGVAGMALTDGGIVVDLRHLNAVTVDPDDGTATAGGGSTMRDLDRATERYGLATTGGRVSTTGLGGFVLGGGGGWMDRKFGLACDNLVSVDVVTANGEVVRASESENSDLFWALHGGGGNFGVATSITLRLYPLPIASAALLLWDPEVGPNVVRAYRDFIEDAPDEIGGGLIYLTGPVEEFVPELLVGKLTCAAFITYAGPKPEALEVMAPMMELDPAGKLIFEGAYADLNSMLDDPPGYRNYWSAEYLDALPDVAVDLFCQRAPDMIVPSPSQHVLFPQGGAVARGPSDYPLPWRSAPWIIHPFGLWSDPAEDGRARQWAHDLRADLRPWASGAVYLNFIGDEGRDRVVAGFGSDNYERLVTVKRKYDPDNVFHRNHNIVP